MENTGENRQIKAGIAIVIKTKWVHNIIKINRIKSRIMQIILKTGAKMGNIPLINSNAPDMNYSNDEHYEY